MKEATKEEEKKDLQIKDALSMDAWMTILSSEINRNQELISHLGSRALAAGALIVAALLGVFGVFVLVNDACIFIMSFLSSILIFSIGFVYVSSSYKMQHQHRKGIETLKSIREEAITGNIDTKEITRRWSEEYKKH